MNKEAPESIALGPLIERLGPLNNRWRDAAPPDKALTLWMMGDALLAATPRPSDAVLWEIQKRSYITRNLLRYALIIRRSWQDRESLARLVAGLCSYTVFREALPFLKGDREGIDEATYQRVVSSLSHANSRQAIAYLKQLKADRIGRQHKKGASVSAAREQAVSFNTALAQLEAEVSAGAPTHAASDDLLLTLSRIAIAIASGDTAEKPRVSADNINGALAAVAGPLLSAARDGRSAMAAFRKLTGAERLMRAADLLNSMRAEPSLAEWRRRNASARM